MRPAIKLPKLGRVPVNELTDSMLALMKEGVTQSRPMAARLGWSVRAIVTRLELLQDMGEIHRTSEHRHPGGIHYHWHLGVLPEGLSDEDTERRIQTKLSGNPLVIRSTSYADIGHRDPLVAALFGAPKASTMNQGAA